MDITVCNLSIFKDGDMVFFLPLLLSAGWNTERIDGSSRHLEHLAVLGMEAICGEITA